MFYLLAELEDFVFFIIFILIAVFNGIKKLLENAKKSDKEPATFQAPKKSQNSSQPKSNGSRPAPPVPPYARKRTSQPSRTTNQTKASASGLNQSNRETRLPADASETTKLSPENQRKRDAYLAKQAAYEKQRELLRQRKKLAQQQSHSKRQTASMKPQEEKQTQKAIVQQPAKPQKKQTLASRKSKEQHKSVHHDAQSKIIAHKQMAHHQKAKQVVAKNELKKTTKQENH